MYISEVLWKHYLKQYCLRCLSVVILKYLLWFSAIHHSRVTFPTPQNISLKSSHSPQTLYIPKYTNHILLLMNPHYVHHRVQVLSSKKPELSFQVHRALFPSIHLALKFNSVIEHSPQIAFIISILCLFFSLSFWLILLPDETKMVFFKLYFNHSLILFPWAPQENTFYIFPFYIVLLLLVNHFYCFARLKVHLSNLEYFISLDLFYST